MIDYFNRTLEIITPRFDDEGNEIEHVVVSNSIQSLISLTIKTSITETEGYYNFSKAISYRFKYTPKQNRQGINKIVHHIYSLISALLFSYQLDVVHINIDDEYFEFNVDDLGDLRFTLDRLLFYPTKI